MREPRKIICHGIEYGSIKAFARAFGMSQRTVQARLGSGMTPEEIVSKPIRQTKRKFMTCEPSLQNCLNCTLEDCYCELPAQPGETVTSNAMKRKTRRKHESTATIYHCVLDLETIEEELNG